MTIFDRALEFVADGMVVGLGSGRASTRFIERLGERVRGGLQVRGVPTSQSSAEVANRVGIPLTTLDQVPGVDVAVDGADEVDPKLNLIKGWGRALVREKIVAASARKFVILVGEEKVVPQLGTRGNLPIEVVPFAVPLVLRRLDSLGLAGTTYTVDGRLFATDNGNHIIDVKLQPVGNAAALERTLTEIPGVVGTGLFLNMADVVLVGDDKSFELRTEHQRNISPLPAGERGRR